MLPMLHVKGGCVSKRMRTRDPCCGEPLLHGAHGSGRLAVALGSLIAPFRVPAVVRHPETILSPRLAWRRWLVYFVFPVFCTSCMILKGIVLFKRGTIADKEVGGGRWSPRRGGGGSGGGGGPQGSPKSGAAGAGGRVICVIGRLCYALREIQPSSVPRGQCFRAVSLMPPQSPLSVGVLPCVVE